MKAILLAGGEGRRLRPITEGRPKPMVRLLDKPVLEYLVLLLRQYGVTELCMTLGYMPEEITAYFGDGRDFGVSIETRVEETPLGTAGGVRACADFIGDDEFLVLSGDAVCSFDLGACMAAHRDTGAEATLVLYAAPAPTEFGLVTTDSEGRVHGFIEKPAWERVVTDCVNTGIYILSPSVLAEIPADTPYDFARDLFPKMLAEGKRVYGCRAPGYWCDVGSPEAYRQCCMDVLEGKTGIPVPGKSLRTGVWADSPVEDGFAAITPPVYIGKNVVVEPGTRIGPGVVLSAGSRVGAGTVLQTSVVDGAGIGRNADVRGAVLCAGAVVGDHSFVKEGAVIGSRTVLGERCLVGERVRIWPERQIPAETRVLENLVSGMLRGDLRFGPEGRMEGEFGLVLTPEACLALGTAAAAFGRVGVASGGGPGARLLAEAVSCGVRAGGGEAVETDADFAAEAAFSGRQLELPLTVFAGQLGREVSLQVFGPGGMPLSRELERKLEAGLSGDTARSADPDSGRVTRVSGIGVLYAAGLTRGQLPCRGLTVSVRGRDRASQTLREVLAICGCTLAESRRGIPTFEVSGSGTALAAEDETGRYLDREQLQVMAAAAELERGSGRVAAPGSAPAALEVLARDMGGVLYRLGRDPEAESLYREQLFLRDGIAQAVRLCTALVAGGETLAELHGRMPRFGSVTREVHLTGDRGAVMRALAASCAEFGADLTDGLTVRLGAGTARITPCRDKSALRIRAESEDTEQAAELCAYFERLARKK